MVQRGVSAIASACGRDGAPSVMRAVGSWVSDDGAEVLIFLARTQSHQLLQDIADTGRVAVVFCEPMTHRSLQIKSSRVRLRETQAGDEALLARYLASMEHEVGLAGFPPEFTRAMLAHEADDLVALHLWPDEAYDQTPGAGAGARLGVPA